MDKMRELKEELKKTNTGRKFLEEAGSLCDVPATPEYIEVPGTNGRVKMRVDDLKKELYKDMVLNPITISYGA